MPETDAKPTTRDGEPKTKRLPSGDVVQEADDCRFVFSPSRTVHERDEFEGDGHDYEYHPQCGQRLPPGSLWGRVDADSPEEIAETYHHLSFCGKCFERSLTLNRKARANR